MHLQIRKKEKYLFISIVCYLLVVSSALFLMFSPVFGYSQFMEQTNLPTSIYSLDYVDMPQFYVNNRTLATSSNITKIEMTLYGKQTNPAKLSGTLNNVIMKWNGGADDGTANYSWSCSGEVNQYGICSITILIDHWHPIVYNGVAGNYQPSNGVDNMGSISFNYTSSAAIVNHPETYPFGIVGSLSNTAWGFAGGTFTAYTGTNVPAVPVINSVTSFPSCLEPGTGVVLESDVTGTVDDWTWEIYDQSDTSVFTGNSPIEQMVDLYLLSPGDYDVQLTVENSGGSDFWQQDNFLHINQSGTCNFTIYEPFPTVTVSPTIQVYPTLTLPSIVDTNMTGINDEIDELWIIGNMSEGYREMVDYYGEGVNTTFTGLVGIIVSPFTFIANAVSTGSALFSTSYASLMSYTTIPLAIVGITLSYYPWQIITLITAGIAIDAVFVLIFGVQ